MMSIKPININRISANVKQNLTHTRSWTMDWLSRVTMANYFSSISSFCCA
jgi:hypothetical protein